MPPTPDLAVAQGAEVDSACVGERAPRSFSVTVARVEVAAAVNHDRVGAAHVHVDDARRDLRDVRSSQVELSGTTV